ncbi:ferric reductase-like transmembrane domain-containing protein [Estrella lausannensis]|uniref:Conserved putative membrane protein n=1 Tax=Estrella lausannensis TaxID=483423 RepID=A0A0H5DQB9_9BACT|nr:ferric reductase-like transmembrane domain-containing protein [Estrella lausannensis]CRX38707.1 Conserved putative membrane protein [Estrella lausannensis]
MSFPTNKLAWIVTQSTALLMLTILLIHPGSWPEIITYSGYFAVGYLVLTLSLNPLRFLFPRFQWIKNINRYRKELGVACFSHAAVHLTSFLVKRGGLSNALPYLAHPAIIPAIWIAFPLLFALALTSNQKSVQILSYPRWKRLHRKVYWAEAAVFIHMVLVGKWILALMLFIPLLLVQWLRKKGEKSGR